MIFYISGKMTGLHNKNKDEFNAAEKLLTEKGHVVLNPASLPDGLRNNSYMSIGVAFIDASDAIYMLSSHADSKGAEIELKYALYQNKKVFFEGAEDVPVAHKDTGAEP